MDHTSLYDKFTKEINKLVQMKDILSENKPSFSVSLNIDADEERKSIVNNIVKAIQSKTEKNLYVKFENLFRLYNVMEQYKIKYSQDNDSNDNGKKAKQLLLNDITSKGNYKVIRKAIRIYHYFNCLKLKSFGNAYKFCQISPREFDMLCDEKWTNLANIYEFENDYNIDYLYWRVRNRKRKEKKESNSDSDKTISDLDN